MKGSDFYTLEELKQVSFQEYGLDYLEALEMAYENAVRGIDAAREEVWAKACTLFGVHPDRPTANQQREETP